MTKLRRLALIIILLGAGCAGVAARGADRAAFEAAFEDATLRVDYHHGGNATAEYAAWDRSARQPGGWAGSRVHLVDTLAVGRTLVEVRDAASGELLFSKRSDSYWAEYRTTAPALAGVVRVYHESALVPFPRRKIRFSVSVRQPDRGHKLLFAREIDPADPAGVEAEAPLPGVTVVDAHVGGDPHAKVDVAILGEGYARADEAKFRADLARFTATLLGQEPFKAHRDRFNVRGAWLPSAEAGADEPARGIWRATALGTRFDSLGSERYLLTEDNRTLRAVAARVPYDAIYVMVNTPRYGGGGIYNLYCTFTSDNQWNPYVFLHEFGHSFAALADEYYSSNVAYNDFFPRGVEPIEPNITALLDPKALKWADLATPGTPVPTPWGKDEFDAAEVAYQKRRERLNAAITAAARSGAPEADVARLKEEAEAASHDHVARVDARVKAGPLAGVVGAFEGAGYTAKGLYRPAVDCIMFSRGDKPFCAVCRRAIERTISTYTEDDPAPAR